MKYGLYSGGAAVLVGMGACHKSNNNSSSTSGTTDVGSGDIGILNFAYALEQLEAAFYIQVNAKFYVNATAAEQSILSDIMNHEICHRDFFKNALGSSAIPALTPDFSSIDFTSRASVLGTAKALEDTGVSAYNGAGQYISSADYLTIAGKIVSVEARHAAAIRDLLNPDSADFAGDDVVDMTTGLDFLENPQFHYGRAKHRCDGQHLPQDKNIGYPTAIILQHTDMKVIKLIDEVYNEEVIRKNFSRRETLTKGLGFGLKAVLAAIPLGLLDTFENKAMAGPSNDTIVGILNFALTLEYFESTFYTMGLAASGLIPSSDMTVMMQISKHETDHVATLTSTIMSLMGTPVAKPTFDFTANGTYPDVFTNYQTFLALSNAFEDTGVRAYKGQAPALLGAGAVLTAALDIHSVKHGMRRK